MTDPAVLLKTEGPAKTYRGVVADDLPTLVARAASVRTLAGKSKAGRRTHAGTCDPFVRRDSGAMTPRGSSDATADP